jgi:hypothetical protein
VSGVEDLEQYVTPPAPANKSMIGALVIALVIAATAVALYMWESSGRQAPEPPGAPATP